VRQKADGPALRSDSRPEASNPISVRYRTAAFHQHVKGSAEKQLPARSLEGHACRARAKGIDHRTLHSGRDKHVPPEKVGGARLSCPLRRDGSSIAVRRTRQAGPSGKRTSQGTNGGRGTFPPLHGLGDRVPPRPVSSVPPGPTAKPVKAKAFTRKRR